MLLYIAATNQVVSTALVVEHPEDGKTHKVQRPVYYLSEVLSPAQQRYPHYQKLAYSVFMTARKLPHYFEVHQITVVCDTSIASILNNPKATGRVLQWGIEIAPLDISYLPRLALKLQVLPDFISDWTELQTPGPPDLSSLWKMYFDDSKRHTGAGSGGECDVQPHREYEQDALHKIDLLAARWFHDQLHDLGL